MISHMRPAISIFVMFTILTGILYPSLVTVIAQTLFPHQANGSLIRQEDRMIGSSLIGQSFTNPKYFWGRISATSPSPYNAASSSGSNLGPSNAALIAAVQERVNALKQYDTSKDLVPVDLVTSSASGLDPHISPAAAEYQVARIASSRNLSEGKIHDLVAQCTQGRQFGLLGEPRVNVLELNIALDKVKGSEPLPNE
jgi:potassium-transporting ATPase KdpC subunit